VQFPVGKECSILSPSTAQAAQVLKFYLKLEVDMRRQTFQRWHATSRSDISLLTASELVITAK